MSKVWKRVYEEPVACQAMIVSGIALGSAFGLGWNGDQVGAVTSFTAVVLGFLTRSVVTPFGNKPLPPPLP